MENNTETRIKKGLVEGTSQLKVGYFGRSLIKMPGDDKLPIKSGRFNFYGEEGKIDLSYKLNLEIQPLNLELRFSMNSGDERNFFFQNIRLAEQPITFGDRWYFQCSCGHNASILYFSDKHKKWLCRDCCNLTYEVCRLNRQTMGGLFFYTSRISRLMAKREAIDRMFYRNQFTKKAERWIYWQKKWGFEIDDEVKRFAELQLKIGQKTNFDK